MSKVARTTVIWRLALAGVVGVIALIAGGFSLSTPIAGAQEATDRTVIGSDLHIQQGDVVAGNVTVTDGNAVVDGEVLGNVVVLQGDATISGKVGGDVSVGNGDAVLEAGSVVTGNVLVLAGGQIKRDQGATVGGEASIVNVPIPGMNSVTGKPGVPDSSSQNFARGLAGSVTRIASLIAWLGLSLLLMVVVLGFALVVPQRLQVSSGTLDAAPGPSVALGLIVAFLLGPVTGVLMMVLAITIVGIALIPVLGIVLMLALLFGLSNISLWLGRRVYDSVRHGQNSHQNGHQNGAGVQGPQRVLLEAGLGLGVLLCATLFPTLVLPGWIGFLLWALVYFAACIGLGAGVMSRFGTLLPPVKRIPAVG